MFELIDKIAEVMPAFLLTFSRLSALTLTLPIISYPMITTRTRVSIVLMMCIVLFPLIADTNLVITNNYDLVLAVFKEVGIGLLLGLGTRVIFESFSWAGAVMGRQMGIAMANVMDPTSTGQIPIVSQFWLLVIVAYFFAIDGHQMLFNTLYRNFEVVPVGTGILTEASGRILLATGGQAFINTIQFAAPAIVFLLTVDTAIAFTAKIMPQMNIFMVAMPLKIATGIVVLMISLDMFEMLFDIVYEGMQETIANSIQAVKGV